MHGRIRGLDYDLGAMTPTALARPGPARRDRAGRRPPGGRRRAPRSRRRPSPPGDVARGRPVRPPTPVSAATSPPSSRPTPAGTLRAGATGDPARLGEPDEPRPRGDVRRRPDARLRHPRDPGRQPDDDHEHVRRPDRPARAQHDRGPARRAPGPCARPWTARRSASRVDDQTLVVPLGGILPDGGDVQVRVDLPRDAAERPDRPELDVHAAPTASPSSTAGCPWISLRARRSTGRTSATRS